MLFKLSASIPNLFSSPIAEGIETEGAHGSYLRSADVQCNLESLGLKTACGHHPLAQHPTSEILALALVQGSSSGVHLWLVAASATPPLITTLLH
jgi:hypothetical protein